ncbi:MAG: hypothetical protein ABIH00_01980 [Armatimonadota bacterium]
MSDGIIRQTHELLSEQLPGAQRAKAREYLKNLFGDQTLDLMTQSLSKFTEEFQGRLVVRINDKWMKVNSGFSVTEQERIVSFLSGGNSTEVNRIGERLLNEMLMDRNTPKFIVRIFTVEKAHDTFLSLCCNLDGIKTQIETGVFGAKYVTDFVLDSAALDAEGKILLEKYAARLNRTVPAAGVDKFRKNVKVKSSSVSNFEGLNKPKGGMRGIRCFRIKIKNFKVKRFKFPWI